ncbi:carbon-phosphorus lyase complex subunit PhnI [Acidithiobacillus sp. CV18-2]|uniref:Carbon-phosphorus lyase complex subunit PhnI n=1 Tax=Igneacidithiobacillus copahuensis TaxID=2724909 RepID=A0AAE2YSK1_9PROT|nr:carbon-phosphorus lyase complex subunit PhnI [Igneacidithiobacillus copahuensis]MBU2755791.1 carbon-phosphorus lyase complex subunit PhnI [Acidithiobacillus sp. CV18-3]MBU2757741.1 carbon-phosphorus lyase complex subunit PhnI [Acidithiobacillus sp. BN09-2]MBU2777396.1 carbon-phosphorus lyase complex subunit PhnI [Acidithiobacillus sp. CV18-2]MBU2796170.1 carbon-phosphorus lyase complex subunit PhnI [Acidithiobacillus sp. VAN18-2]MBU2798511.1 carbon-phosphorus lyase complex subunit PhnI [Aci
MSYVASKGGEAAIDQAHRLVAQEIEGRIDDTARITETLRSQRKAIDRVMAEAALHAPKLAAQALLQGQGDVLEAVFLLRAYAATLPRLGEALPIALDDARAERRISAVFKDLPGGQRLGATYDYSHRLIGFFAGMELPQHDLESNAKHGESGNLAEILTREGILEASSANEKGPAVPPDLREEPLQFPAPRALRLQALARADEGFVLGLAYSTQRGYGHTHPFLGELRSGPARVYVQLPGIVEAVCIGEVHAVEAETVHQPATEQAQFTRGYGLQLGGNERKAIAMALVDRALRGAELGEECNAPAQDQEFVLAHGDNVAAMGFLEHLKLPHHVDFQSELQTLRNLRQETLKDPAAGADDASVV